AERSLEIGDEVERLRGENRLVALAANLDARWELHLHRCRLTPMTLAGDLRRLLPAESVIDEPEQLRTYECDGLTGHRVVPEVVVLPSSIEEVVEVVRVCHAGGLPFVARGAGTGLSGGALPVA